MTLSTRGLTANLSREHSFEPLSIEGSLPAGLAGTLVRNGPGVMERFGVRYQHLFEGDGAVTALRLENGRASGASRIIQTDGYVREEVAGRHLASFAAPWPVRLWNMHRGGLKNTANTSVLHWQDRLFALMEGAPPVELDPQTLDTVGQVSLGVIDGAFSAHPHRVPSLNTTFNFGLSYGRQTYLNVYALPDHGSARHLTRVPLEQAVLLHDFIATEHHLVFFVAPLRLNLVRMMLAIGPFHKAFQWTPDAGTEVIIIPLQSPESVVRFTVPAFYVWHFMNAYSEGDTIVVDYIREEDASSFGDFVDVDQMAFEEPKMLGAGRLHRARIDLGRRSLESTPLGDTIAEFPMVRPHQSGRPHSEGWVQVERFHEGLLEFGLGRVTEEGWQTRWLDRGKMCGEPVFVESGEDGCLISLVYSGETQRSEWLISHARTLDPLAVIPLPHAIPVTFHGSWLAE